MTFTRDTKQASPIEMSRARNGATIAEITTGWLSQTVRGAIAGAVKKKLGLNALTGNNET